MADFIRNVCSSFISILPPAAGDAAADLRWRWTISLAVILLLALILVNAAVAYGYLPPLWYAPETQLAALRGQMDSLAAQTKTMAVDVDMTLKLDLGKQMRDDQSNRCSATSSAQKMNLSNTIDAEQQYYYRRFGTYYALPDCAQL